MDTHGPTALTPLHQTVAPATAELPSKAADTRLAACALDGGLPTVSSAVAHIRRRNRQPVCPPAGARTGLARCAAVAAAAAAAAAA